MKNWSFRGRSEFKIVPFGTEGNPRSAVVNVQYVLTVPLTPSYITA